MLLRCRTCGIPKPATSENFYRQERGGDALRSSCKDCEQIRHRNWQITNMPEVLEYWSHYASEHPESVRAYQNNWRVKNRERACEASREWRIANPEAARELSARRRARKKGIVVSKVDLRNLLALYGMTCHICSQAIASTRDLHWDHVIPLSRGGTHSTDNLRPAHAACNLSKAAKLPDHEIVRSCVRTQESGRNDLTHRATCE